MKIITRTLLLVLLSTKLFAQQVVFETFSFEAIITDTQSLNAEVGSCMDNIHKTHIAWVQIVNEVPTVMYTVFDPVTKQFTTTSVDPNFNGDQKIAPYIVTDANNAPHITYLIRRDRTVSSHVGNYAVMYASDLDKDGVFEVVQVLINPVYINTDNNG
jgi:hypothetical protein